MGQRIARFLINLFIALVARIEVHDAEYANQQPEGFVIASNHIGRLDAILIYQFTRPQRYHYAGGGKIS